MSSPEPNTKPVIFTDLDGTLLDRTNYSFKQAADAINYVKKNNIPIIFCSAKTRKEQEYYRKEMGIYHPFIVENGGAIYIPREYFKFSYDCSHQTEEYNVIALGTSHNIVRKTLDEIRIKTGIKITGFEDMTVKEIARITGLNIDMAALAREREYDEAIIPLTDAAANQEMLDAIIQAKLNYTSGGQLYEVMGNNDKGKATNILTEFFRKQLGRIITIGIGDNINDIPMLQQVDLPYLVQKPDGNWEQMDIKDKMPHKIPAVGPSGWAMAIEEVARITANNK
jgi:mannosyl-3-phosphoglycerate phosphatase